ncbi:unnamed protein product [Didymodactylos carnosus]|uniref:MARVEL domain-containing protein n=1 Tax=Didymodactylos carnosus TaxID=1234261 RepID=A0A814F3S8_9BILA|nr:unnamed protein product [Didymodactylos carnosus]CAF3748998.1 unnamed protein product [Didymodactylos carnosus]
MKPQAFGAGRAGSMFDPIEFLKKPQVILRLVAWVFAIVVFACIAQEGHVSGQLYTALDIYFPNLSNINHRKYVVLSELIVSGIFVVFWFTAFCYMADQWRREKYKELPNWNGRNSVQAAIAFAFFSIIVWIALAYFAFHRYREGVSDLFCSSYEDHTNNPVGDQAQASYPGFTGVVGTSSGFQQPPFIPTLQISNYQPPNNDILIQRAQIENADKNNDSTKVTNIIHNYFFTNK